MFLITGATGNVGSQMVNQLLAGGRQVRVFTRDTAKVAQWSNRVQIASGDLTRPATFADALTGVEGAFLMNGALDGVLFRQLVAAAKAHAVPRIVFLSTIFAADPLSAIGRFHKDKEDALRESGLPVAIVRAGGFMSNAYQWIPSIKEEGVVYNPMGNGQTASIAPEDIAAVAVHALLMPSLAETVFEITGGSLLTTSEKVSILAKILGKPLRTVDVPAEAAVQGLVRNGIPAHIATALGQSFESIRNGGAATITDTVRRVTGRLPRTFESWAQAHAARFA